MCLDTRSYLLSRFKLIGIVVHVKNIESNDRHLAVIVQPMCNASWQCNNISLCNAMNFLVLISKLLALSTLGRLCLIKLSKLLLEGLWASREC